MNQPAPSSTSVALAEEAVAPPVRLVARTRRLDVADAADLLALLPEDAPVAWIRNGEGLVGWGVAARVTASGASRFADADTWWNTVVAAAQVNDEVAQPGTGLVAFGTFGFSDAHTGDSSLVVPRVVVGRRGEHAWVTTVAVAGEAPADLTDDDADVWRTEVSATRAPHGLTFSDGSLDGETWMGVVADAVRRIDAGDLDKVVLARDLLARADDDVDVRWPLRRLATQYPTCWTFHVDGMFGATPEMLLRRERGLVTSRILAGTIRRTGDEARDLALAGQLAHSSKDLEEHEYAVRSVADALGPHCSSMNVPESPFVLHLPNVMHLATDVNGVVSDAAAASSLKLAEALHPSAAVGGTPTPTATALIAEIEGMDRARYAAPVGWIDAAGDGEWGIALRSGHVSGNQVRLFAGCGIVSGSEPASELAESQAKFVPVRDSLATD
ncbi:isochorismate synthase [Nocardioides yefusunii]|uniref:isochorismate synthase n=1 Tax=Nocardioides yefusunii TaxID=2500546 RepID=A0ABW1QX39_9ACTN|nr:isochorismate synthase [Nocardioides yefusunii]